MLVSLKAVPSAVLDLLLPPRCAFCGCLMEHSGCGVCGDCESGLSSLENGGIRELNGLACTSAFYYDGVVRDGIHRLKFDKKSWCAAVFGRYTARNAAACFPDAFDAVTFVPVSFRRNFERGFDQAQLLARSAAKELHLPMFRTLRKVRNNPPQSRLGDPSQRQENVKGVYRPFLPARIKGRRFLLVDDVITTGSTAAASAAVLLDAGAERVVCVSLAGGHEEKRLSKPKDMCYTEPIIS